MAHPEMRMLRVLIKKRLEKLEYYIRVPGHSPHLQPARVTTSLLHFSRHGSPPRAHWRQAPISLLQGTRLFHQIVHVFRVDHIRGFCFGSIHHRGKSLRRLSNRGNDSEK